MFLDRFLVGILNGCCGRKVLYVIDPTVRSRIYEPCTIPEEARNYERPFGEREERLREALQIALSASRVFQKCRPRFADNGWHWKVVNIDQICRKLSKLRVLSEDERTQLAATLQAEGPREISYSRFCLLVGEVLKDRHT